MIKRVKVELHYTMSPITNLNHLTPVVINFMYQFDQAKGCPASWDNIISGVSLTSFLEEIIPLISRLSEEDLPSPV